MSYSKQEEAVAFFFCPKTTSLIQFNFESQVSLLKPVFTALFYIEM